MQNFPLVNFIKWLENPTGIALLENFKNQKKLHKKKNLPSLRNYITAFLGVE